MLGNITIETVQSNAHQSPISLTIAIPTYRDSPEALVKALGNCTYAENSALLIYDDGSNDPKLLTSCQNAIASWRADASLIIGTENMGRAYARNRLVHHAKTDWILFLDADMLPDNEAFLHRYMDEISVHPDPALIAGGFSLDQVNPSTEQALHAAQSLKSECLAAKTRAEQPGRFVFTSNILVHKAVLSEVQFDSEFSGWGWEDVDWGLRVADAFPVIHIDNTASHLGLDDTETLLSKYGGSGANFARMVKRHPEAAKDMTLAKVARRLSSFPGRSFIKSLSKLTARSRLPNGLRLQALKLYRAASYAEHLK